MTTTEQQIKDLKTTLNFMTRIVQNMQTEDFEALDGLNRTIRDMGAQLFELELSLAPETNEDGELIAA